MEGDFEPINLFKPAEVDRAKPVPDGSEALLDHIESEVAGGGVSEVGDECPHGSSGGFEFSRKGSIVCVRLYLDMSLHFSNVDIHPLEH